MNLYEQDMGDAVSPGPLQGVPQMTETLNQMIERAYRASPGTAAFILERAQQIFKKSRKEIDQICIERFGSVFGH